MSRRLQLAVHCAIDARNTTGESPLWSARDAAPYWVDIPDGVIHCRQPATGERRLWRLPAAVGSIGLRESEGLVVALRTGFHLFDPCFGGPAGRTMDVTLHREDHSVEELARSPHAGGVFMLEPGVAGAPAACYQG